MRGISYHPSAKRKNPSSLIIPPRDTQYILRLTNERPSDDSFVFIWSGRAHGTRPNFGIYFFAPSSPRSYSNAQWYTGHPMLSR